MAGSSSLAVRGAQAGMVTFLLLILWLKSKMPKGVKYAKGLPILGRTPHSIKSLLNKSLVKDYYDMHEKLGSTYACHCLGQPVIVTRDPEVIKHFLSDNFSNYEKGDSFIKPFEDLLGGGIFNSDGEKWLHQRKVSTKMFSKRAFDGHIGQIVMANSRKVYDVLGRTNGEPTCVFSLMNRYTLDTIGEIGFSKDIGSIANPDSPFLKSFDYVQQTLIYRFFLSLGFPTWKVMRALGLGMEKDFPEHMGRLNTFCTDIVNDLRKKAAEGEDSSFVGLLANAPQTADVRAQGEAVFYKYLRDAVFAFLLAGRDTTAQCMTWTLFELTLAPEVVEKCREEVKRVCGDGPIAYSNVNDLRYIKDVLQEGLRLHPSVANDVKFSVKADKLPGDLHVSAGTAMIYVPWSQGRDPTIWGDDFAAFRPERWQERGHQPSSYEFVAFNAGPRECLGKRLAQVEMAIFLAGFVREFDFELAMPREECRYDSQLTLGCSSGMRMSVTKRAAAA